MTISPQHLKAQNRLYELLIRHYVGVRLEMELPTSNTKYIYDGDEFTIKPYKLDVYVYYPRLKCNCKHNQMGIEVDGKKGHKTSKHQYHRDMVRTEILKSQYEGIYIHRFDTKDLVGRGYVNPKTKKRHSILTDDEILTELGVKCTHV